MTARTITSLSDLEALPVGAGIVDKHGDLGLIDRVNREIVVQYAQAGLVSLANARRYLPATVVHDPSEARTASAPVVPVVSDAAVEAVAHDPHAALAPELVVLLDGLDADAENDNYSKGDAAEEIRAALRRACGCAPDATRPMGALHARRCPTRLDLRQRAIAEGCGSAPSSTREVVETITIPRPHVPHGPAHLSRDLADADYLRKAARDLEEFYKPFGSNLRATIVALIRDAADAITPRADR